MVAKQDEYDDELVFIGVFGAVVGALSAVITASLINPDARKKAGKFIKQFSKQAKSTINHLNQISEEINSQADTNDKITKGSKI